MSGTTDAPGFTLRLRATLAAPLTRVFELLTEPDQIRRWFGPHGYTATHVEMDPRVGGTYRITMHPPEGEDFHIRGVLREVVPTERLVYTFDYEEPGPDDVETLVTLTLREPSPGSTELEQEQGGFATEAALELHRDGWSDSLERLAELIAN